MEWILGMDNNWCTEREQGVKQWNEKTISYHSASLGNCFSFFLSNDVSLLWKFKTGRISRRKLVFRFNTEKYGNMSLCVPLWLCTDMRKIKNQEMRHKMSKHNFHSRVNLASFVRNILSNLTKAHCLSELRSF